MKKVEENAKELSDAGCLEIETFSKKLKQSGLIQEANNSNCKMQLSNSVKQDIYNLSTGKSSSDSFDPLPSIAILIALISLGCTWWNNRQQKNKSIEDDYWLRTVAFPSVIEVLIDINRESSDKFRSAKDREEFFVNYFLDEMNRLRDATIILNVGYPKLYIEANEVIDKLDDLLDEVSNITEYCDVFGAFNNEFCMILKNAQKKI